MQFYIDFVYPSGKPRILHLLRCRGFAVDDYSFTLGRLGSEASSTFAQLGLIISADIFFKDMIEVDF